MDEGSFTIKDIAANLGVSPTTVHKALRNKKGIGDDTRERILTYVRENNFHLNKVASALKRRPIKLAALLIEPVRSRRFFYADILSGVTNAMEELAPFNVSLETYFSPLKAERQLEILGDIFKDRANVIDGLLIIPAHETMLSDMLRQFIQKDIKVVTVNSDTKPGSRHACVASDTAMSGRLAGELMCTLGIGQGKKLLMMAGNRDMHNHQRTSRNFLAYINDERPDVDVLEIYGGNDEEDALRRLRQFLDVFSDIAGIYCNTSVDTLGMCRMLKEMGMAGRMPVIGSDVFEELIPYFDERVITASIFQKPWTQGYQGINSLYNLITGETEIKQRIELSTGIAFRSNASSFLGITSDK